MADIGTNSGRPVKQCSNTRASRGPSRIVGNKECHRVTAGPSWIQPRAHNQDSITNFFTSFKGCWASNVRSVVASSCSSLHVKRVLRAPRIASSTHLSPNRSFDRIVRLIIGDYIVIDSTAISTSP
eukprot:Gb_03430 [translate_table: standard]